MATHRAPPAGKHSRRIPGESLLPLLHQFIRGCWIAVIAAWLIASAPGLAQTRTKSFPPSLLPQEIPGQIRSAAEDTSGTVWAVPFSNNELYRWESNHWVTVAGPGGNWMPLGLWRDTDGGVIVTWSSYRILPSLQTSSSGIAPSAPRFAQSSLVTWRRGNEVRRIAQIDSSINSIIPTTSGRILIVSNGPQILLAQPGSSPRPVYALRIEQFFLNPRPLSSFPRPFFQTVQLSGAHDARGRTWLWCDAPAAGFNPSVLQGFLIYDGKSFSYRRALPGLPSRRFSYVGRWDASHFIAAVLADGLYLIDTANSSAQRVSDPEPYAFRFVQKVFGVGTDRYVISSAGRGRFSSSPFHDAVTTLWRFRNNHWQKVLAGVDTVSAFGPNARPWAHMRDGLWLGSIMHGLWFVPANGGKPKVIDWRQGFPFDSPAFVFALRQNRLLAIKVFTHGSTVVLSPGSLLSTPALRANIRLIRTHFLLQPDAKHRIWGFVDGLAPGLDEWNGARWVTHPLPSNLSLAWIGSLDADAQGRIWLFPRCRSGPAAFFGPVRRTWREFASYRRALEDQRPNSHAIAGFIAWRPWSR